MMGLMFAGCEESPGEMNCSRAENTRYTVAWPIAAMENGVRIVISRRMQRNWYPKVSRVSHTKVEDTVFQLLGGLRSGMGYCGHRISKPWERDRADSNISAASLSRAILAISTSPRKPELQRG